VVGLSIVVATAASYALGWLIGVPQLLPLLNTIASFPFMVAALSRGRVRLAVSRMLVWALAMAVCATAMSYARPWATDALFLRGASYRAEMFAWVLTGRGAESEPARFIPQHVAHFALFALAAFATAGIGAMAMGAMLMNYMGHYVGSLAAASARPFATAMLGWHPWSVVRIASFVTLGVILSGPLLSRIGQFRVNWAEARPLAVYACLGLVVDVLLKWLLAPAWQRLLLRVVGW
jgi:hypothetical protein